jgi:hypothetical protein
VGGGAGEEREKEREKQYKHAYDKIMAEGREKKIVAKEMHCKGCSSEQCLKSYRYEHTNESDRCLE